MTLAELRTVRHLKEQVEALSKRVHALRKLHPFLTSRQTGLPRSMSFTSSVERAILCLEEKELELATLQTEYEAAQEKLTDRILTEFADPLEQSLLIFYYVEGLSLRQAARRLNYSLRQIFRVRDSILNKLSQAESLESP